MKLALLLIGLTLPQLVAENFHGIDFKNFSYPYRFWNGRNAHVPLKTGEHEYDIKTDRGWFRLSHVYLTDVTGDNRPEAIVMLWHVSCGASCDGGSALFYIYRFQNHRLKLLWQYETGSLAYGCGLKSFAAKGTTLTVEQFGRCTRRNRNLNETSLTGKFQVDGVTRITLKSNGSRFVAHKRKFFSTPERSVLNYEPQIDIAP
jgi:hypothetical protein